jgi:hypothetical protein
MNAVSFSSARTTNRFPSSRCAPTTKSFASWRLHPQGELLEQPEDFEDDYDNDNHSNYVKDVSAHAGDSYQIARAMVNTYQNLSAIHRRFAYESTQPLAGT